MVRNVVEEKSGRVDDAGEEEGLPGLKAIVARPLAWLQWQRNRVSIPFLQNNGWVVGIRDPVDIAEANSGFLEHVSDRVEGQLIRKERYGPLGVLDAGEPLFFGGRQGDSVPDERGRRIVEGRVYSQHVYHLLEISVRK
jgi:hypothetical protein